MWKRARRGSVGEQPGVALAQRIAAAALQNVTVRDDGPGFSPAILGRLGEPYLTERDREGAAGGLGLGFFISKTLLERTGAKLEVRNRRPPNQGAMVKTVWPRSSIEAPAL